MREPYISQAESLLGENSIVFSMPGVYTQTEMLVADGSLVKDNTDALIALIKALLKAEEFAEQHPDEAITAVAEKLGTPLEEMEAIWPGLNLKVEMNQATLITLEDQAEWAISHQLVDRNSIPNFLDYISVEVLKEVKPAALTIIQ